MAGTLEGGREAAKVIKAKYGHDFYAKIGAKGGSAGRTGGFGSDKVGADGLTGRERASKVGSVGGSRSRRKPLDFKAHY